LVIATDISNPQGVTMWRNGALATTASSAARSDAATGSALPRSRTAPGPSSCRPDSSVSPSNRSGVAASRDIDRADRDCVEGFLSAGRFDQLPVRPNATEGARHHHPSKLAVVHNQSFVLHVSLISRKVRTDLVAYRPDCKNVNYIKPTTPERAGPVRITK
jgi:hypothetical protein